jgi:hypothetical protein
MHAFQGYAPLVDRRRVNSDKEGFGEWIEVLCGRERHEFAVHEETLESAFFAAGSKLKVRTLLVVNV